MKIVVTIRMVIRATTVTVVTLKTTMTFPRVPSWRWMEILLVLNRLISAGLPYG